MSLSYTHGVSEVPLLGETVGCNFDRNAALYPDHEALVVPFQQIRWTYTDLAKRVDRLAAGLLALGLGPGDRIGIWSTNNARRSGGSSGQKIR
jgi:fatty-acyl-CoA synthase